MTSTTDAVPVQLPLFDLPDIPEPPLRHRWLWFPFRPSECARCYMIWPPGASVTDMVFQECPGQALNMGFNVYLY